MNIERNLIIAVLKLTRNGSVSHKLINKEANIPLQNCRKLLSKLQNDGLVYVNEGFVEADGAQRLKLAVKAINLGADIETVSILLRWQEFEEIAATALERNGYSVARNIHFSYAGRKWEMDVVGCRKPIALCIDCKHWHRAISPSALKVIVEEQTQRTWAFAEALPTLADKVECITWGNMKLIPAVLSLVAGKFKFYDNVPVVPVLQLQDFINQLPAYINALRYFTKP
ncbi:MAG: restriction endonuclease [Candidatus Bathyarchaeales archaeon]